MRKFEEMWTLVEMDRVAKATERRWPKEKEQLDKGDGLAHTHHPTHTQKNEIGEQCKGVYCVDLGECFQTHIFLQNFASIQPRTSPVKFARPSSFGLPIDASAEPSQPR